MGRNPRDVRKAAGVSQLRVAADTNSSIPTVRLYEADPAAVSPGKRSEFDPYYRQLAERAARAD